jgi:hypothetical protein
VLALFGRNTAADANATFFDSQQECTPLRHARSFMRCKQRYVLFIVFTFLNGAAAKNL